LLPELIGHAEVVITPGDADGRATPVSGDGRYAPVVIRGDGLVLREWTDGDLPRMAELFDDAAVARWTPL